MAGKSERKAAASAVAEKSERNDGGGQRNSHSRLRGDERVITLMKAISDVFADEGDYDYDDYGDDDDDCRCPHHP